MSSFNVTAGTAPWPAHPPGPPEAMRRSGRSGRVLAHARAQAPADGRAGGSLSLLLAWLAWLACVVLVASCGGGGGEGPVGDTPEARQGMPALLSESGPKTAVAGTSVTFSVAASGATGYQWQKLEGGATQWSDIPGATAASLVVDNVSPSQSGTQYRVVVSNPAGSVTSSSFALTVEAAVVAPLVTAHPADIVVVEGTSATLSVAASGDGLAYVWELSSDGGQSWLPVPGALQANLVLPSAALSDDGKRFRALVSNAAGTATSQPARLTVTAAPVAPSIATQPASQHANPGQAVGFTVVALGTTPAYQWQASADGGASWSPVADATSATLTLPAVTLADHGRRFRVQVSNAAGSATSAEAVLTVTAAIVPVAINAQPASLKVKEGQTAAFVVGASGTTPTFAWQVNSGAGWVAVGGGLVADAPTLTVPGVTLGDSGKRFRAVVANAAGSKTSDEATLTVEPIVTAPAIGVQPASTSRIVGQAASFAVAATATGATPTYQWQSRSGVGVWAPLAGATGTTLTLAAVDIAEDGRQFRAVVSTPGHAVVSDEATLRVSWGSVVTSADTTRLESTGGGDDGGSPGGGDGAGSDGGGGLGKTVGALLTVHRLVDGALVGQALTHPQTGLVKIKAGPGAAPFLLTLSGTEKARYYDEGQAELTGPLTAMLPFGPEQVLHALVDKLDENVGVTPLTEAAYRYAINHFLADPAQVAAGKEPLRRSADLRELSRLTPEQIREAHAVVLKEINGRLSDVYRLESLKALPTPVDGNAATDALKLSRYGRQQAVTGGLVAAAGLFKKVDVKQPALALVEQLARDLTDGKLDGYALDGKPAAPEGETPVYDATRLPADLAFGANRQAELFGKVTIYPVVPDIVEVGEQWATYANDCPRWRDHVSLLKDGRVRLERTTYTASPTALPDCQQTEQTEVVPDFMTGVRQLHSNGYQGFLLRTDGQVYGWGNAACGTLGDGSLEGTVDKPKRIDALAKLTSMAVGEYAVAARDASGQVYTFGANADGSLGLGPRPLGAVDCRISDSKLQFLSVLTPQLVRAAGETTSVHVVRGRSFYAVRGDGLLVGWGSGQANAFGGDSTAARDTPAPVDGLKSVRTVAGTYDTTFALITKGIVLGWGSNAGGGFGDGTTSPKLAPEALRLPSAVQDLVADGLGQAIALLDDGSVVGWGPAFTSVDPATGKPVRRAARPPAAIEGLGAVKIRHLQLGNGPDAVIYLLAQDGRVFKLDGQRNPFVAADVTARFDR